ncbi:hypothetical protein ColKHC_03025 [Colletotrichum higginsianum]|nr:hypothetical protein ColKHC_03025 [Colletotrichum higginsianum]
MDAIGTSEQFVDRCYARFAQGGFTGTFIDAYDIFHAAVVYVCLAWRMSQQPPAEHFRLWRLFNGYCWLFRHV